MNYVPVQILALKECFREPPFDIYIKLSDQNFVKAFDRKTGIDFHRLASYETKEIKELYALESDKNHLEFFLKQSALFTLCDRNASFPDKVKAFTAAMEQSIFEIFEKKQFTKANAQKAYLSIKLACEGDVNFIKLFKPLAQLSAQKEIYYRHAISTAIFSYMLALDCGVFSPKDLTVLVFSSIFHDLGKLKLPENIRVLKPTLTREEKIEHQKHPLYAIDIFQNYVPSIGEDVKRCVLEHKERISGEGFPNRLDGSKIYNLSKILAIADFYSEALLGLYDGKTFGRDEALAELEKSKKHFDPKFLERFLDLK